MQAAHILYPTVKYKIPSLVVVGIDQDVFIKLSRDIAHKLKLFKPGDILSKFLPSLSGKSKMSASNPNSAIYTTDSMKDVEKKINKAFSGGKDTIEEHRKKGGNPDIDICYQYLDLFLEDNQAKLDKIYRDYKSGDLLTGDLKKYTIKKLKEFLKKHQIKREIAKSKIDKFLV